MRGYMAHPCDEELTLEKKLRLFLTMSLRAYNVPKEETEQAIRFVEGLDIRTISEQVMQALFRALAMRFEFPSRGSRCQHKNRSQYVLQGSTPLIGIYPDAIPFCSKTRSPWGTGGAREESEELA